MSVLSTKNLSKSFTVKIKKPGFKESLKSIFSPVMSEVNAVSNVSFEVDEGEAVAFIGPNGAGKSTTIKMLTGILVPSSGDISVLGLCPYKDRVKLSYKIGTVFGQKSQLWFHLPAHDTFDLMADIYEIDRVEYKYRLKRIIADFQLEELMNIPVRKLSLGQRIRCEIAVSILHEPKILFLDEPTIGLDVVVKNQIRELIHDMNRKTGMTVFLTSHDVGDIEKLCKRILIIDKGKVILESTTYRLKHEFLKKKILSLKLDSEYIPQHDGISVLKSKGTGLKLSVDTSKVQIQYVIQNILSRTGIQDMNISDTPMEDVIRKIYTGDDSDGQTQEVL